PEPRSRPFVGYSVLVLAVLVILSGPLAVASDGVVRYEALDKLLRTGKLDPVKYSLAGPICSAPLWFLGEAVGHTKDVVGAFNRIVFVLMAAGLWLVARPLLGERERLRFVLFLLVGSLFPWHSGGYFGELFYAACVGLGLAVVATRPGRWGWVGWPLVIWGTVNVPAAVPGLALGLGVLCWHRRRLRYALAVVAAVALVFLENYLRRGSAFDAGYKLDKGYPTALPFSGLPNFSYPIFFGLLSILFSFGKGLVFFTPGLFLRYPRASHDEREARVRLLYWVWVAVVVGLVLVFARWWSWYGGAVWGPRFFLFASLPASLVLARLTTNAAGRSLWANTLTLAAVTLSCWAAANGMVFETHGHDVFWANNFALESLTWYVPECSALWWPFVRPKPLEWHDWLRLAAFAVAYVYLAGPVAVALARQLRERAVAGWRAFRTGPRFKF
ncbi:MAG TPA: hypothetical protein VMZ71_15035, partial [Gemmataceae bacterium]|nr:hypothetical protein [Gemmataceae bacterium]